MSEAPRIAWAEAGAARSARWRSESGLAAPRRVTVVDDTLKADAALRLASEGNALLWRGDFHNARQLLTAVAHRIDRKPRKTAPTLLDTFHAHRQAQAQRTRILGSLLVEVEPGWRIALGRAPDVAAACTEAWGAPSEEASVVALRELLGLIGAHEWRRKGVEIPALGPPPGNRIHPHYGVFSPVRGEYLDLIAQAPLPSTDLAFDIGTGTGVIAALLVRRGVERIVATDLDARALACATDNLQRLGIASQVDVVRANLFPEGLAPLVVCNPPWLPGKASSPIEHAIYDEGSRMLRGFLGGVRQHLAPGGEAWLVMSDLAERIGLRAERELPGWIAAGGLAVVERLDTRPRHPKAGDENDPLHAARSREITSLWRLSAAA